MPSRNQFIAPQQLVMPNRDRALTANEFMKWAKNLYLESSFTPTIDYSSTGSGIVYGDQNGQYIKIGNMIFFNLFVRTTNKGTSSLPSDIVTVKGLPLSDNFNDWVIQTEILGIIGVNPIKTYGLLSGQSARPSSNSYEVDIALYYNDDSGAPNPVTYADINTTTTIKATGFYSITTVRH